jgi:hypothetical protein
MVRLEQQIKMMSIQFVWLGKHCGQTKAFKYEEIRLEEHVSANGRKYQIPDFSSM